MLLIDITLTRLTSTEMAKLPSNQIKVKKSEWKIRRHVFVLNKTLNLVISLWFFSEDGNEM